MINELGDGARFNERELSDIKRDTKKGIWRLVAD